MKEFDELTEEAEDAGLYGQVLASRQLLLHRHPQGVDVEVIGLHAWSQLDLEDQVKGLRNALGAYVVRVSDEQAIQQLDRDVRDPSVTYLDEDYEAALSDNVADVVHLLGQDPDVEVTVSAAALDSVLGELNLLRCRLASAHGKPIGE